MKEIDGKGHILIHTIKITTEDGEWVSIATPDYSHARDWERLTTASLEWEGWVCAVEIDSEWMDESEWHDGAAAFAESCGWRI